MLATFPQQTKEKLGKLGHHLVRTQKSLPSVTLLYSPNRNFECINCGTVFTIDGGWDIFDGFYQTYQQRVYYWTGFWEEYPPITCNDLIIRNIIL